MRWRQRPEKSNWGDFGPDDEAGRLNLITPRKVLEGIAEVRDGRTFCLSLPLDFPGGNILHSARHPPKRRPTSGANGLPRYLLPLSRDNPDLTDVVCDDQVVLHTQYSTQWDAFSHMGAEFDADGDGVAEIVFYNGWRGGEASHGSMFHRAPGSIGASSDPSRVWPGHKLPGRMGGVQRTTLNVTVARVLPEQNLILIRGAVPGANGSLVMVRKSIKTSKAQQQKAAEKK